MGILNDNFPSVSDVRPSTRRAYARPASALTTSRRRREDIAESPGNMESPDGVGR